MIIKNKCKLNALKSGKCTLYVNKVCYKCSLYIKNNIDRNPYDLNEAPGFRKIKK